MNPTPPLTLTIEAGRSQPYYWRDLWRFRELFYVLAWRDLSVRYKQTTVGVAWALLQPLATMVVFSLVFGRLFKAPSEGVPYPLLVLAGLIPWQFFSSSLSHAGDSVVVNANLVSKVYFPRMIVPIAAIVVALTDFLIAFGLLLVAAAWFHHGPTLRLLWLPLFTLLAFVAALGPGLLITALNVEYRDFRYVIPFIVQFGLYISPVGYSATVVPEAWRLLYSLNPMVGVIDGFRWALLGGNTTLDLPGLMVSSGVALAFLGVGLAYFRRLERTFADVI